MHVRGNARSRFVVRSAVESLEGRQLLSVDFVASTGSLNVVGSAGDDVIVVAPHRNLMNVIDVTVTTPTGTEEKLVVSGPIKTINVASGAGADRITFDKGLAGLKDYTAVWIDSGDGNDIVTPGPLSGTVLLGAGDDQLTSAVDAELEIGGGAGNDRINVAKRFGSINGDAGDDRITAQLCFGPISGGDGNDKIQLLHPTAPSDGYWTRGDAGNDTIIASDGSNELVDGDAGDDLLIISKGNHGTFMGGDGDDVIDANGSSDCDLEGGNGDDDLYSGTRTYGYGQAGHDWFEPDTGWTKTDYSKKEDISPGKTPNTSTYVPGGSWSGSSTVISVGNGGYLADWNRYRVLKPLDGLGYVVIDQVNTGSSVGLRSRILGAIASFSTDTPLLSGRPTSAPSLSRAERKGVTTGILRLPGKWKLSAPKPAKDGLVWYDVRLKGGDGVKSDEFGGTMYQLCVKQGSILIEDAANAAKTTILRTPLYYAAFNLPAKSNVHIAGNATTYRLASTVPEGLRVVGPIGRRAILVDGGVIWLPFKDQGTNYTPGIA